MGLFDFMFKENKPVSEVVSIEYCGGNSEDVPGTYNNAVVVGAKYFFARVRVNVNRTSEIVWRARFMMSMGNVVHPREDAPQGYVLQCRYKVPREQGVCLDLPPVRVDFVKPCSMAFVLCDEEGNTLKSEFIHVYTAEDAADFNIHP